MEFQSHGVTQSGQNGRTLLSTDVHSPNSFASPRTTLTPHSFLVLSVHVSACAGGGAHACGVGGHRQSVFPPTVRVLEPELRSSDVTSVLTYGAILTAQILIL